MEWRYETQAGGMESATLLGSGDLFDLRVLNMVTPHACTIMLPPIHAQCVEVGVFISFPNKHFNATAAATPVTVFRVSLTSLNELLEQHLHLLGQSKPDPTFCNSCASQCSPDETPAAS